MVYKTLKKVSEYCQLVDKNKVSNDNAIKYGVTWVNNGDGTWVANGTLTENESYYYIQGYPYTSELKLFAKHKYLLTNAEDLDTSECQLWFVVNLHLVASYNGFYNSEKDESAAIGLNVIGSAGKVVSNLIFKPQLFDLTEMYGAGNEPTTVEEFRTKFTNELYDYKQYCFVKSYKTLLKAADDKIITSYKKSLKVTDSILL